MFFSLASAKYGKILTMKTTPINGPIALRIRDRLAAVICTRFGSLRAWAEHIGEPYQSVAGRFHHQEFRLRFAEAVCRDLGVDLLSLAAPVPEPESAAEGTVIVPLIRPVACRDGEIVAERIGTLPMPSEFIPAGCIRPTMAVAMDDGMAPEILKGDLLLLDCDAEKRTRVRSGETYLVHVGGAIVPRRVYTTDNSTRYIVRPASPAVPPEVINFLPRDAERVLLGVVVGAWRGGRK